MRIMFKDVEQPHFRFLRKIIRKEGKNKDWRETSPCVR